MARSKEPHSVDQPHEALLVAAEYDLIVCIGAQQHVRCVDHEIRIDRLPFRNLAGNPLETVLAALRIDGGDQRGAAADEGSQERRNWAQEGWVDVHDASRERGPESSASACRGASASASGSGFLIRNQVT